MTYPTAAAPLGETRLYLRSEMDAPETLALEAGEAVVFSTARRPGLAPNEDAAAVVPLTDRRAVLLLADGMGGAAAGDRAAGIAIRCVTDRLLGAGPGGSGIRNAILDGIEAADREVRELELGAGTTFVAVELSPDRVRCYHTGDSMAVLIDAAGRPRWRTTPHSPVGYAIEAGLLDEARAMSHQARHLLTNAVGKLAMHVEVGPHRLLLPSDTVIVASDGLFDNLLLSEVGDRVSHRELREAVSDLVGAAARRMISPDSSDISKPDDLTVLAFRPRPPEALGTLDFEPVESA
jgi:serine/threonine protein phosphatase PrpC